MNLQPFGGNALAMKSYYRSICSMLNYKNFIPLQDALVLATGFHLEYIYVFIEFCMLSIDQEEKKEKTISLTLENYEEIKADWAEIFAYTRFRFSDISRIGPTADRNLKKLITEVAEGKIPDITYKSISVLLKREMDLAPYRLVHDEKFTSKRIMTPCAPLAAKPSTFFKPPIPMGTKFEH